MTTYDRILLGLILALGLCLAALCAHGQPVPKVKDRRPKTELTQGAGAAALLSAPTAAKAATTRTMLLTWQWQETPYHWRSNIVFHVFTKSNLAAPWQHLGQTTNMHFVEPWQAQPRFYAVAASNVVTEQISPQLP